MGYSMGATTAMHGMKHAHLAQQLKAYLHIDQTPKISVDATWQYGLFGPLHAQFKQLLNDIYQLLSIHKMLNIFMNYHFRTVKSWCGCG